MSKIEIYSKPTCPYCVRALNLLEKKGLAYSEINLLDEPQRHQEMLDRAEGRHTVPQIFIDGKGVGGCDELFALDASGQLDKLLKCTQ